MEVDNVVQPVSKRTEKAARSLLFLILLGLAIHRFFPFWLPSLVGFPLVLVLQRMTDQAASGPGMQ